MPQLGDIVHIDDCCAFFVYWVPLRFAMENTKNKEQYARELACLTPKVTTAENRAAEIEGLVDQMNLRLSLLNSSNKKASEEMQRLKVHIVHETGEYFAVNLAAAEPKM